MKAEELIQVLIDELESFPNTDAKLMVFGKQVADAVIGEIEGMKDDTKSDDEIATINNILDSLRKMK